MPRKPIPDQNALNALGPHLEGSQSVYMYTTNALTVKFQLYQTATIEVK